MIFHPIFTWFLDKTRAVIAERAGIKRESLYRALSPKGNPTMKTLLAVIGAVGLKLSVQTQAPAH